MNKQDAVKAVRDFSIWCKGHHIWGGGCDCPFSVQDETDELCVLAGNLTPDCWNVEEKLRNRGLENG